MGYISHYKSGACVGEQITEQKHTFLGAGLYRKLIGARASDEDAEYVIPIDPSLPNAEILKSTSTALTYCLVSSLITVCPVPKCPAQGWFITSSQ